MDGKGQRTISHEFQGMGAAAARVRDLGKCAAWLLDSFAVAAQVSDAPAGLLKNIRDFAQEARYGLPASMAPLARLRVPGITREHLMRLHGDTRIELHDLETILDSSDDVFDGLLTPLQLADLRQAILADIEESMRRKRAGHVTRAEQTTLPRKVVEELYAAEGGGLEQAVRDALTHAGISATRNLRQPHGEEDVRVAHPDGTVIISVTASKDDARPIRWTKAREILGAGAGLNPINYVCVGRPSFESLAERCAADIARETGARSILLVPIPVLAEALIRISEDRMHPQQLSDLLALRSGMLVAEDLPAERVPR
jgi:hypothetical protein